MTKINKKIADSDVHSHNDVVAFLDKHLKNGYAKEAKKRLKEIGLEVSESSIRNAKSGYREDWNVLKILAEIASENQVARVATTELINNN